MQTIHWPSLEQVSSAALTDRLYELRKQERGLLVEFLTYLAELDRRKVFLELGFNSLFSFLTDHLGFTKSAAFRRSTAARLLARFPEVAGHLADGRLCLTTFVELRDVLDEERLDEILDRAAGRSEEQVKELVAALRPQPAPQDLLRRLPEPRPPKDPPPAQPTLAFAAGPGRFTVPPAPPARSAPRVEPISEELRVLRMTVGREFVADLEAVRSALSHEIPDGNLGKVIHECMRRTLRAHSRRQVGSGDRHVPAPVRDAVWLRDEGRCAFVGADGHRCGSTWQLQYHHIVPFARGGEATVENIMIVCSIHNGYLADIDYGSEHMTRARRTAARG